MTSVTSEVDLVPEDHHRRSDVRVEKTPRGR